MEDNFLKDLDNALNGVQGGNKDAAKDIPHVAISGTANSNNGGKLFSNKKLNIIIGISMAVMIFSIIGVAVWANF